MRKIDTLIIHCTATPEGKDFTANDIDRWHRDRGFDGIGYHYVIRLDGTVEQGRDIAKKGAHCYGHNASSIGICYVGGMTADGKAAKDTRTCKQRMALRKLVAQLCADYGIASSRIYGHNELAKRDCPCFDVGKEFRS